jgi:GR25 family glycosyltransferase involved in LPS biosynthesis
MFPIILLIINTVLLILILVYHFIFNKRIERFINDGVNITATDIDIYLINLERNNERLINFKNKYNNTDLEPIPIKRVNAIDGKKIDAKLYVSDKAYDELLYAEKKGFRTRHYQITRGAVGCYLSHMNTYKMIANGDKEYAIIFEDDVKFNTNKILEEIQNKCKSIKADWDIMLMGCVCYVCNGFNEYYEAQKFILLHAYLIKKESAKKIIELLDNKPIEKQIDSKFSDLAEEGLLKIVCLKEHLAIQNNEFTTTIQLPIKKIPGVNPFLN